MQEQILILQYEDICVDFIKIQLCQHIIFKIATIHQNICKVCPLRDYLERRNSHFMNNESSPFALKYIYVVICLMGFRMRLEVQGRRRDMILSVCFLFLQKRNISIPLHLFPSFNLISNLYHLPVVPLYQAINWCSALSPYLHTCPQTNPFHLLPSYQLNLNKTLIAHCTIFWLHSYALQSQHKGCFFSF